jgi:hypothetical protein
MGLRGRAGEANEKGAHVLRSAPLRLGGTPRRRRTIARVMDCTSEDSQQRGISRSCAQEKRLACSLARACKRLRRRTAAAAAAAPAAGTSAARRRQRLGKQRETAIR